jgi:Kef-type K+ transport system membrane component KefB
MENIWFVAAAWMALALVASVISIRIGISVALVEIFVGVLGGNFLGFHTAPWIDFLATFGSGLLTFLAGAEIDPESLRKHLKPSLIIGGISFLIPFLGAMTFAYLVIGWDLRAAQIAGIALSTTSVAVVYAVMVETGLNQADLGKLILAACFVTDLGTVLELGVLFASFNAWMAVFVVVWPLTRLFRMSAREGHYTTLLMSTGLTFGSISALYGLTNGIIDQTQYTILVTVVVGSAFVPTFIAQTWFQPEQALVTVTVASETASTAQFDHEPLADLPRIEPEAVSDRRRGDRAG